MCESARERAWEQRMAILEAIHAEISPQLQALRDADEENFIGPVVHFEL